MNAAQHVLLTGIQLYRWISPAKTFIFGPLGQCRFTPSCSAYALEAITKHGAAAGSWLALKRLCRCHPWGGCGEDPVPAGAARSGASKPCCRARGVRDVGHDASMAIPQDAQSL